MEWSSTRSGNKWESEIYHSSGEYEGQKLYIIPYIYPYFILVHGFRWADDYPHLARNCMCFGGE